MEYTNVSCNSIETSMKQSANELFCLESLSDITFVLNIESSALPQIRAILARRIAHHGGKIALSPDSHLAYVVVPNVFTAVPLAKPLLLRDLIEILEKLDSTEIPWHVARGLPLESQKDDLIAISSRNMEGTMYHQEWHKFGFTFNGKVNVHKIRMDAPKGSGVILTDEQYLMALRKKDELKQRYQDKLKLKPNPQIERHKREINLCLICRQKYQFYEEHIKSKGHKEAILKSEPVYQELDSILDTLKLENAPKSDKVVVKEQLKSTGIQQVFFPTSPEKSDLSTMIPFKRKLQESGSSLYSSKRSKFDFDKEKGESIKIPASLEKVTRKNKRKEMHKNINGMRKRRLDSPFS